MASLDSSLERSVLENLVPNLEAKGYQVFIQPPRSLLPPFMGNYRPDAIALKPGKNIAIEVMSPVRAGDEKARKLQNLFSPQPDWELQVYYAPLRTAEPIIDVAHRASIQQTIDALPQFSEMAGRVPALLTAWAAFEAVGRALAPDRLARAQTPTRLLEVLASDGYVTPDEADKLREISQLRNKAAHGGFGVTVTEAHLNQLVATIKSLLSMLRDSNS
jgi:hypothetical protein